MSAALVGWIDSHEFRALSRNAVAGPAIAHERRADPKEASISDFAPALKEGNRDPRVACALLLDTSSSMGSHTPSGVPIEQLNRGYEAFCEDIKEDPLARKRTEVVVVTFGGSAQIAVPFQEGRDLVPQVFSATGNTPMGAALDIALDQVVARKQEYKDAGLEYFRPWIFLITDGAPTDSDAFERACQRVRAAEEQKAVTVFAVGVDGADMATLARVSSRQPVSLKGLSFIELFLWLSASMSIVSDSSPGSNDQQVAANESNEQLALPSPEGWATW